MISTEPKKPTVGAEALKRLKKPEKQEIGETSQAMLKGYEKEVWECIERHKNLGDSFYVVVLHKKERLMKNVIRRYFFARQSEPTPDYDQAVFYYDKKDGDNVTFKWVVPDKPTCDDMVMCGHLYPLDKQQLVQFCRDFKAQRLADYQRQ